MYTSIHVSGQMCIVLLCRKSLTPRRRSLKLIQQANDGQALVLVSQSLIQGWQILFDTNDWDICFLKVILTSKNGKCSLVFNLSFVFHCNWPSHNTLHVTFKVIQKCFLLILILKLMCISYKDKCCEFWVNGKVIKLSFFSPPFTPTFTTHTLLHSLFKITQCQSISECSQRELNETAFAKKFVFFSDFLSVRSPLHCFSYYALVFLSIPRTDLKNPIFQHTAFEISCSSRHSIQFHKRKGIQTMVFSQ